MRILRSGLWVVVASVALFSCSDSRTASTRAPLGANDVREVEEPGEVLARDIQYAEARTAPGIVLPGAYGAAYASLAGLPTYGGSWSEVTHIPYDSDDPRYRDPSSSNSGGGAGFVAGRMTGLAVAGDGTIYAGGADGGVFRSADGGVTWVPLTDGLPTLSVGDLRLADDGSLWLATGEANTGATSYVGSGVYRLASPRTGVFTSSMRVGGNELESTTIGKLRFDGAGSVYAATSRGLWKHSAAATSGGWTRVLYPVPDPPDPADQSPYANIANDVAIQPGTGGRVVIANLAWRGGASYNGFYLSTDGGNTFALVNPTGALNAQDIGRSTFAYSKDGSHLYVIVESITRYTHTANTTLGGVFDSPSGKVAGPWNKIADSQKLASSGSVESGAWWRGYRPGVQAWYNQFLAVDPANPSHLYLGLEEVYETRDAGVHWDTIGPYWNFGLRCWNVDPSLDTCPPTTHADQHSVAIAGGHVYVGNDGGVWKRSLDGSGGWVNLNANLRTLQYYSVGVGKVAGGVAVSGGLQDNGQSLLLPGDVHMGSPFGGDGGATIVDPDDGCKILGEYVFLWLELTTNCGRSDGTTSAVLDVAPVAGGDPTARFIAPVVADETRKDHWVAGSEFIWTQTNGFEIQSGDEWSKAFDNGPGHATTALASRNDVVYAGWCGPCNNAGFARGVSTNAGGTWHPIPMTGLPNRYISAIAIDPADASGRTAYLGFNGFSRTWTEGPGAGVGHLWRTTDGGAHWADVSGTLPDVPADDLIIAGGKWIVATDLGNVVSTDGGAHWSRLGTNFPYTTVMDLTAGPDGRLYAATHGRGIWSIAMP